MVTKNKMPEKETEASSAFDCLAVTNVQVYPFQEGPSMGHTKGIASIVLNDQFMIRGLRVMDGENGLFVGQLREHIENCILEKYQASIV